MGKASQLEDAGRLLTGRGGRVAVGGGDRCG